MLKSFSRRFAAALSALTLAGVVLTAHAQVPKPSPSPKMAGKTARKMPMRDPKTGRFVKASPSPKPSATPLPRDPKTGRFMKRGGATTPKGAATPTPDRAPKPGK